MTPTSARWGILAASGVANRFAEDLRRVEGAQLTAVGSRSIDRAQAFAELHGVPTAYGSYEELAASPDVDIVYVSSIHVWHYAHAKLCLEHGKSVLCEKPFTMDLEQAAELASLARNRGLLLMEAMWTRCNPLLIQLKEQVAAGAIGDLIRVQASIGPMAGRNPRVRDLASGGGALLECGVYPLNFAYHFLGRPGTISAWGHLTPAGIDDAETVVLGYGSGRHAVLTVSFVPDVNGGLRSSGALIGTRGWIDVPADVFFPAEADLFTPDADPVHTTVRRVGNGYVEEAAEATRCLREGLTDSPLVPLDDTLETVRILDEVRRQIGLVYPDPADPREGES